MKIVIDIPKETYKALVINQYCGSKSNLENIIVNGKLLPEHHGRLKDIDAFITKVKADRKHACYVRSWTADDILNALDNNYAPTIIEADKE